MVVCKRQMNGMGFVEENNGKMDEIVEERLENDGGVCGCVL